MSKIKNLTPHNVVVGEIAIPATGTVARCTEVTNPIKTVDGIQVVTKVYGKVENLPPCQEDTYYVVSAMVRLALPERKDLLSPGDLVRDSSGNITGCKNLVMNL